MTRIWQDDALCAQVDHDGWFPDLGGSHAHAKAICNGTETRKPCPVRVECLTFALTHGETAYGVWGGMSPRERMALARKGKKAA